MHNACGDRVIAGKYLTPRDMNDIEKKMVSGKNVVFQSKEDALEFIEKKFPDFPQEVAGSRGPQGWHFDSHPLYGSSDNIDHINIYSKASKFRVHFTWSD